MLNETRELNIKPSKKLKRAWPLVVLASLFAGLVIWWEVTLLKTASMPVPIYAAVYADDSSLMSGSDPLFSELSFYNEVEAAHLDISEQQRSTDAEISKKFNKALAASQNNSIEEAIALYQDIVTSKPNHQMAAINLALMYQRNKAWQTAYTILEKALKIAGGSRKGKIYALMGKSDMKLERYAQAISNYKKSIEYRPSHENTWRQLALASALNREDYTDVLSLFDKSIALSAENPKSYLEKAQFQFESLDPEGTLKTLTGMQNLILSQQQYKQKQTLELLSFLERNRMTKIKKVLIDHKTNEASSSAFLQALVLISDKRYQDALVLIGDQDVESDLGARLLLKAHSLKKLKDYQRASESLDQLAQVAQFRTLAEFKKGLLAKEQGLKLHGIEPQDKELQGIERQQHLLKAQKILKPLLNRANFQADLARELSIVAAHLGLSSDALGHAELALSHGRGKRRFDYQRIEVERQFGSLEKALRMSESLAHRYPKSRSVLRQWARSLDDLGRTQEAIEKYRLLTKSNEKKSDLRTLAKLLKESQEIEASSEVLETLLAKYSNDTEARYLYAENLCSAGKLNECQLQANRVLRLDQDHARAKELIARLALTSTHG